MISKEIEKILLSHQINIGHHVCGNHKTRKIEQCCNVFLEETAQTITKHLVEMFPKEKPTWERYEEGKTTSWVELGVQIENTGYNQCLKDLKERIGKC